MVIQHNIAAINSYRNLGVNQKGLNKNLERLSSGYKINRAGDDAAGLAISESMRSQINGLNPVSYTQRDVYKRQILQTPTARWWRAGTRLTETGIIFILVRVRWPEMSVSTDFISIRMAYGRRDR